MAKSVNSHYMLPAVIEHLPQECFVPLGKHIEQWAECKLGKDWRTDVVIVLSGSKQSEQNRYDKCFDAHWLFQFPVFFTKEFYEANATM